MFRANILSREWNFTWIISVHQWQIQVCGVDYIFISTLRAHLSSKQSWKIAFSVRISLYLVSVTNDAVVRRPTLEDCIILYWEALGWTLPYCIIQYWDALHLTVWYLTGLHCDALYQSTLATVELTLAFLSGKTRTPARRAPGKLS